jgi:hypothetical protein
MHHLMNSETFDQVQPRIQLLDSNIDTFMDEIKKLDQISPTLYCTGQIFYLKKNQNTLAESFTNMVFNDIYEI